MSNEKSGSPNITVGHLHAAITRTELWLDTLREAIAALPPETELSIDPSSKTAEKLMALQPNVPEKC